MRKIVAFYAWQSDTPEKFNRHLIRIALEEAAKRITEDPTIDAQFIIEYDTEGVPGTPPISQTILNKIEACDIFIPDVSFVARTEAGKFVPNPNVMTEYGYALHAKSHAAMMPIMNTAFGPPKELPFDMGHLRFPVQYHVETDAADGQRRAVRRALSQQLEEKLRLQETATRPVPPAPIPFPAAEVKDGPARFRAHDEALGIRERAGMLDPSIFLTPGPAMWLRLMPPFDLGKNWTIQELRTALNQGINLPLLFGPSNGIFTIRADDGVGIVYFPDSQQTSSVAFAFKTGEIWAIDRWIPSAQPLMILAVEIERCFTEQLWRYGYFLSLLGVKAPYRWIAGITGARGRQLQFPMRMAGMPGPVCASENVIGEGAYDGEQSPMSALLPFFKDIYDSCGIERPASLPQA
jgi:hypothetical protein